MQLCPKSSQKYYENRTQFIDWLLLELKVDQQGHSHYFYYFKIGIYYIICTIFLQYYFITNTL